MANPSRGRPRLSGTAKVIRLRSSVFDLWNERKVSFGFGAATNSEFAEFLLHRPSEESKRNLSVEPVLDVSDNNLAHFCPIVSSTPLQAKKRTSEAVQKRFSKRARPIDFVETSLEQPSQTIDVDVTGTTKSAISLNESQVSHSQSSVILIPGNPYSILEHNNSDVSDIDSDIDSDCCEGNAEFDSRINMIIDEMNNSDDSELSTDSEEDELTLTALECPAGELTMTAIEGVSEEQAEEPWTEVDFPDHYYEEITSNNTTATTTPTGDASGPVEPTGDASGPVEKKKVEDNFKDRFNQLTTTANLKNMVSLYEQARFIVSVEKLVELSGCVCTHMIEGKVCGASLTHSTKTVASRVVITWKCSEGHFGKWESSEVLSQNRNTNIYLIDCMIPIAILLSGNNYAKFELLAKAMNLKVIGKTAFLNFQRHCAAPVISNMWVKMKDAVSDILKSDDNICLCGDGRNDSPGHCARYSVYSLMDHSSKVLVDVEVVDKRECGGNSTIMEREGLRRLLHRLMSKLAIKELCTDASSTIIKMLREMKERFPELKNLCHSLDVWHKAKKLSKSLHKAAKVKGCEDLKVWVEPTVNHFWYCCQIANGDAEILKKSWLGLLHHVCGEHTWAESSCSHEPETESNTKYLRKSSKAMEALRKIVLDAKWLKTLHFYVKFRHTGDLESFNSMMTKYVPKRMAFEYQYFIMRTLLAAIDHNMHLFRKPKESKQGQILGHRKFSKRTQRFHAEVVKEEKQYKYFPCLAAKMLHVRAKFKGSFSAKADTDEFNPKHIFPTIGMVPAPSTQELLKAPSRFKANVQGPDSENQIEGEKITTEEDAPISL